ncbi:hypothetical protein [Streptomyces xylophagus]|uniref:hypothetical protein n=1 Tax=Streptomyces xylophagus TaxID=285514 RepID=UPI0005B7D3F0|nr:hypothetical protein [Streptomyces xylophagus]
MVGSIVRMLRGMVLDSAGQCQGWVFAVANVPFLVPQPERAGPPPSHPDASGAGALTPAERDAWRKFVDGLSGRDDEGAGWQSDGHDCVR